MFRRRQVASASGASSACGSSRGTCEEPRSGCSSRRKQLARARSALPNTNFSDDPDFLGTTIHASWPLVDYALDDANFGVAYITDLLRTASGGRPWWITELQAVLSLFGERPANPSPEELTRWLWDGIGAGAMGTIFWCWHPRRFGREGGESGLVNADASSTARSEAVKRVTQALAGPAMLLHHAQPQPARVAILYNRPGLGTAAFGLARAGNPFGFVLPLPMR